MHTDLLRVLITDEERALLFSLSNYLTFRGCLVDCAERMDDARALVKHLHYDVVVVGLSAGSDPVHAEMLTADIRTHHPGTRVVAIAALPAASETNANSNANSNASANASLAADHVVGRNLPLDQLAWSVCSAIAA